MQEIPRSKLAVSEGKFRLVPRSTLVPIDYQMEKVGWFKGI